MVMQSAKIQVELEASKKAKQNDLKENQPLSLQPSKSCLKRSRTMFEDLKDGFLIRFLPQESDLELCDAFKDEKFSDIQDLLKLIRLGDCKKKNSDEVFEEQEEEKIQEQAAMRTQAQNQEVILEITTNQEEEKFQDELLETDELPTPKKVVKKSYKTYGIDF